MAPNPARLASLKAAMSIVPPRVITIAIWLTRKLSSRDLVQALAKVVAWMLILGITWANLDSYFLGITWAAWWIVPNDFVVGFGMIGFFSLRPSCYLLFCGT